MIPSLPDRLSSMRRALESVIIPAIPTDNGLAIEQAHLLLAHLGLIDEQADHIEQYEIAELAALEALAGGLAREAGGGERTLAAAQELRATLDAPSPEDAKTRRERTVAISMAIERLVSASGDDGSPAFCTVSQNLIIADCERTSLRDRAWFKSTGFERGDTTLASPATLFSA